MTPIALPARGTILAASTAAALALWTTAAAREAPGPQDTAAAQPRPCNNMWPAWSPDGRRVVFASDRSGDPELYLLTVGEREPVRLTRAAGRDAHPSFSPDGRQIAFQSPREGSDTNLYVMTADGSDQRRITSHTGFAGVPVWSPDGTRLLYQWTPEFPKEKWRLMSVAARGGAPRQLTDGSANDQVPNWSPDGRQIVFHSDRHGPNQLYTMAADGSAVRRLTTSGTEDRSAAYSPDGRYLAFMSERDVRPAGVYLLALADGTIRRIGTHAIGHGIPFVSPDGTRVLATMPQPAGSQIWSIRIEDGRHDVLAACEGQR